MDQAFQPVITGLKEKFGAETQEFRGEITLRLPAGQVIPALQVLRDEYGFKLLIDITAVDYWPQEEPRFNVVYHLLRMADSLVLCIRVALDGNAPSLETAEKIWPNANWFEREVWDLFGIRFEGHSDLRRIIMPYEWEGHPLRKDYPLGYEEVQFTFNAAEIMAKKTHPQERT